MSDTNELGGKRAVVLLAAKFQDEEGVETTAFLREHGMEVVTAGIEPGPAEGKYGRQTVEIERAVKDLDAGEFDLLVIPGGAAPETLRLDADVLAFTQAFFEAAKPVAAICHGPQVLISARVLPGRTVTCYEGIRDDVQLAGAKYVDRTVMADGNLVTSRKPSDIPAFNKAVLELLTGVKTEVGAGE